MPLAAAARTARAAVAAAVARRALGHANTLALRSNALSSSSSSSSSSNDNNKTAHSIPIDLSTRKTVVVGVSGGVDSALTLALLCAANEHRVVAAHLRSWDAAEEGGSGDGDSPEHCEAAAERADARRVARELGCELAEVDLSREYWHEVFAPALDAYAAGLTPNPDVACNVHVKFGAFAEHARRRLGADLVATGHYARLRPRAGSASGSLVSLLAGADTAYDQSYFLAGVGSGALSRALFPLGEMLKADVRAAAAARALHVAQKRTSTGLCFVGRRRFGDFISSYVAGGLEAGEFVDVESGRAVGAHAGVALHTIGQRARLGGANEAYFVAGKDAQRRVLYVARESQSDALLTRGAATGAFSWVAGAAPAAADSVAGMRVTFKARYATPTAGATAWAASSAHAPRVPPSGFWRAPEAALGGVETMSGGAGAGVVVRFDEPAKAITPGQMLVLYDGDECLGGGPIQAVGQSLFEERRAEGATAGAVRRETPFVII